MKIQLVSAAFVLAQCAAPESGGYGAGTQVCELRVDQPHISYGELEKGQGKKIVGKVTVQCRKRVTAHTTEVLLQFDRTEDEWVLMGEPKIDHRIPRTGSRGRITVQAVFVGCVEGWWRTVVKATSVYEGRTTTTPEQVRRAYIPC